MALTTDTTNRPSVKQVYKLARLLLDTAGLTFPENKAAASKLIDQLVEAGGAPAAAGATSDIPF